MDKRLELFRQNATPEIRKRLFPPEENEIKENEIKENEIQEKENQEN